MRAATSSRIGSCLAALFIVLGSPASPVTAQTPAQLRDAGIEGAPEVWVHIDDQGTVIDTRIYKSSDVEALDAAALEVAKVMRFTPARNGDQPVAIWVVIPIRFSVMR